MKKRILIIISIIVILGLIIGVTLSLIKKNVFNQNIGFTVSGLDAYIIYSKGTDTLTGILNPASDYTDTDISTEITLYKNTSKTIYGHIYLDISSITSNLANEAALKWIITSNNVILGDGNFNGYTTNDSIPIKTNIPLTTTQQKFQIYIWLDESMNINDEIEGDTLSTIIRAEASENTIGNNNEVLVTFDTQGGTLETTSKYVNVSNDYGYLPTPTRDGYTFKGWNGKNIFPDSDIVNSSKWTPNQNVIVTKQNDYVQVLYNQTVSSPGYIYLHNNEIFNPNKQYTISVKAKGIGTNNLSLGVYGIVVADWHNLSNDSFKELSSTFTFASATQNYILFFENLYIAENPIGTGFQLKDLMVVEGSVATPYEPYYIQPDTTVVQEKNHTLKAIWEENT